VAQEAELQTYERDYLSDLRKLNVARFPAVALGSEPYISFWKIVSIEQNAFGTPVLSLRAKYSLGDLPELIADKVPSEIVQPISEALDKVESSVNRLSPVEVIDRCRDALSIVFAFQADNRGMDLVSSIDAYLRAVNKDSSVREDLRSWCGRIVARLHSRGKPNEQAGKGLRVPSEDDAELAVDCLKTVLIEFGWAR
jgi:hypothetical protein